MRSFATLAATLAALAPAYGATPFDGTYRGGSTLSGGAGVGRCDPGREFSLTVRDGAFTWRGAGVEATVPVAADGNFTGVSGRRTITGKISGSQFTATTGGTNCNYAWALSK